VVNQLLGETLETYCKAGRCPLYYTKVDATPAEFIAQLDAAIRLRQERLAGKNPYNRKLEQWRWDAYLTFEYARRLVQQEAFEKDKAERDAEAAMAEIGGGVPRKNMVPVRMNIAELRKASDSGAFSFPDADQQMSEGEGIQ
jgi:hypothetical protein